MNKLYEYAIVGGGPAGLLSFDILKNKLSLTPKDIILFEKEEAVCHRLKSYGQFVKNYNSSTLNNWGFLVSGRYDGEMISQYFKTKYPTEYVQSEIKSILNNKKRGYYKLGSSNNMIYFAKNIILATGVKRKEIKVLEKLKSRNFDCIERHVTDLKHIDFKSYEIILLGSGDSVLFKAKKLAGHIYKNYRPLNHTPIIILIKRNLDNHVNPVFKNEVAAFVQKKLIRIVNNCWDFKKVMLNKFGLIKKITSSDSIYIVKAPKGAFLGVYIGYEPNLPSLINCVTDDFITVGDLSLCLNDLPLNLPGALQVTENKLNFYK